MSKRIHKVDWKETQQGKTRYLAERARAQAKANETGFDYGIEANDVFKDFISFILPARDNRQGFELRCEVVSCETLSRCQPGHGPR